MPGGGSLNSRIHRFNRGYIRESDLNDAKDDNGAKTIGKIAEEEQELARVRLKDLT